MSYLPVEQNKAYKARVVLNSSATTSQRVEVFSGDLLLGMKDILNSDFGEFVFYSKQSNRVDFSIRSSEKGFTIKSIQLTEVGDRLCAENPYQNGDGCYAALASIPDRIESLKEAVKSLIDQVDMLFVYLNGYQYVPDFILAYAENNRLEYILDRNGRIAAAGKMHWISQVKGYYFSCDDDIIYPDDYVSNTIKKIEKYERKRVVTYHGSRYRIFSFDTRGDRKHLYKFSDSLHRDRVVDIVGTGVTAFHTSAFNTYKAYAACVKYPRSIDPAFSAYLNQIGVSRICLQRKDHWLFANEKVQHGLYEQKQLDKSLRVRANHALEGGNPWCSVKHRVVFLPVYRVFGDLIKTVFISRKIKKFMNNPIQFFRDSKINFFK